MLADGDGWSVPVYDRLGRNNAVYVLDQLTQFVGRDGSATPIREPKGAPLSIRGMHSRTSVVLFTLRSAVRMRRSLPIYIVLLLCDLSLWLSRVSCAEEL